MSKYLRMFSATLKSRMIYRGDTLLSAAFTFFSVLMYYLLWSLLIPDGGELRGFTLPQMMTYIMISSALTPIVQEDSMMFTMADEIRTGKFAKYINSPVSPFGAFISRSLAGALPRTMFTALCCVIWSLIFSGVMSPLDPRALVWAPLLLALITLFMVLINYLVACCAFRYTDILGIIFVRNALLSFFSGGLAPLEVLLGAAPVWSPFYYLINYPALLLMGRATVAPLTACAVLGGYSALLLLLCLTLARRSRVYFEGVGA